MRSASYTSLFPEGSNKKTVAQLQTLTKRCAKAYSLTQSAFEYGTLQLSKSDCTRIAEMLVDFALDIHSGSGLWMALEKCNTKLFGTPLPLVHNGKTELPAGICAERVQFLLWNLYQQFIPDYVFSHNHSDLLIATEHVTQFLTELLPTLPAVSPVKAFLNKPNDYGWEIKKKLVWLGMDSYLFRSLFEEYVVEHHDGQVSIPVIDDFICQNTTPWSGLGVNDILAACLDIPDEQKEELRSWYLRHMAIYKIVKVGKEITEAINLINNEPYRIREGAPSNPRKNFMRPNMIIHGSLTPWRGEWYWSGLTRDFTPLSADDLADVIKNIKQTTRFVARYWKEREELVRQRGVEHYQQSLKFYGTDLIEFPNGKVYQREETKRLLAHAKSVGRAGHLPNMRFHKDILACNNGIAMFIDPVEGQEMMSDFNDVKTGLKKNGKGLTRDEGMVIRGLLYSDSACPAFVHRVLKEYGGEESVKSAFFWKTEEPYWLDYLMRCHKGEYYRRRFPSIDIVDTNGN